MGTMRQQFTIEQARAAMQAPLYNAPTADPEVLAILQRTVEMDVIPRLLLARRDETTAAVPVTPTVASPQVARLVALLLARDEHAALSYVHGLHAEGVHAETLYLDLLAPSARSLGEMWVNDDCDFTDVTVGLFQLQRVLHGLGAAFGSDVAPAADALRVLLTPLPREQHTFGLSMVSDFFRRAGWNAWSGTVDSEGELAALVANSWFDVIGFSLACDEQLDHATQMVALVRKRSINKDVVVMAGGPGFVDNPDLVRAIGADGTAMNGLQAVQNAGALVAIATGRRCS